jgi:hypothetical protein
MTINIGSINTPATAAQLEQLRRDLGLPTILAQSAIAIPHTTLTTPTQLVLVTIPGGTMGPNGGYRLTLQTSETNDGSNKTLIVRMSGTPIYQAGDSNKTGRIIQLMGWNRGSVGSQLHGMTGIGSPWGGLGGVQVTTSFNTDADQTLQVIVTLADGADTFTIEGYRIETWYGA